MDEPPLDRLPPTRGKLHKNVPLGPQIWLQAGGSADVLFKPADAEDLAHFLSHCPADIPRTILGVGSNVLIRDGGIPGVVIKLGKGFNNIEVSKGKITLGGAVLDRNATLFAAEQGLSGFEYLIGIPGTIGGAIKMNAGAYGQEVKDHLISCKGLTPAGEAITYLREDLTFSHRTSSLPKGFIVTEATFRGTPDHPDVIHGRLQENMKKRAESQPIQKGTGGSTFKNPLPKKAWELIDAAGCRGLRVGQAQMSEKHCNFMINQGAATATDLETLGERVRDKVKAHSGITLEWEVERLGVPA
ncbi:MAG: UDP-N-acetylmuramate dehydrogenase [Holosporaceae bacterium]|nr:MAG: UDP-N-acetylmuramate dehydrogenase [Holosporaceae bacterium]